MNVPKKIAFVATLLVAILVSSVGCETGSTNQKKKLPKLNLHLPKTADEATSRMRELFDQAVADAPLPQPISYEVKEVIHGTGAAAHSHFYLHEPGVEEEAHDDHGHETTGEEIHTVEVPLFTELKDLAKMLPNIAIVGKMDEKPWLELKGLSKDLGTELDSAFKGKSTDQEKREGFKASSEKISGLIEKLETIVKTESSKESDQDE